jgi:GT2 family glycosyltransferase
MHSIDAIVPLYNESLQSILITLNSLNAQTCGIGQVIFVDDASTRPPDYDAAARASRIPARILRFQSNVGISAARNQGAHNSRADFLLFVNCEVELCPQWTERVVNFLAGRPDVGLACGQISRKERTLCARWRTQFFGNKQTWTDATQEIDWALGYAVLIPRTYLWRVGGWNEQLMRAAEDGDMSRRLREAGLRIYQVKGAHSTCHERNTIRVLASKSIRNAGWSLDAGFSGDAFLRPLRFLPALSSFLKLSMDRMARNILRLRWTLLPIDIAVICCGLFLTTQAAWRKAFATRIKPIIVGTLKKVQSRNALD